MLIDTHCHLNDPEAFPRPAEAIRNAVTAGVGQMFVVGVRPADWQRTLDLVDQHPELSAILGCHPNYAAEYNGSGDLEPLLAHPKVVALGEIGLDYHWDFATKEQQFDALRDQLSLARRIKKPVVFHCREAYGDLLTELESQPPHPYLFHCFVGNVDDAARAIAMDCTFGLDGPITYRKSAELREVVLTLPRDRIVLETDSPYLAPVPHRGKRNEPAFLVETNRYLAAMLEMSEEACAELTTANALRFFNRD